MTINIDCTKVAVRTKGDGHWKKYTYQDAEFNITLSGLLVFDDQNWTGWDHLDNQFNFNHVLCRVSFDDGLGNIRTVQGYVMVETAALKYSAGDVVKDDIQLQGNGKLDMFDGLEPCPTVITSITVNGQEDSDGIVHVSYTYTGEAYQVKYRIDNTGDYIYAIADLTLDIPNLSVNDHIIEIIPVCVNGFEGAGMDKDFVVTLGNTCSSEVTGITITAPSGQVSSSDGRVTVLTGTGGPTLAVIMSGSAPHFIINFDGGLYTQYAAGTPISLAGLSAGAHNVGIAPVCDFDDGQVQGPGVTIPFTINSQSSQSRINYSYSNFPPSNSLNIYVNGTLTVSKTNANASSFITVANGAVVKAVLSSSTQPIGSRTGTLTVDDVTTGIRIYNQHGASPFTKQFTFTANGDEFTITGVVSA